MWRRVRVLKERLDRLSQTACPGEGRGLQIGAYAACAHLAVLMLVAMMQVRIMSMGVAQRLVPVPMRMRLRHYALVRMLVVLIMHVTVLVFQRSVLVVVNMAFREMQPEPQSHQETSKRKPQR